MIKNRGGRGEKLTASCNYDMVTAAMNFVNRFQLYELVLRSPKSQKKNKTQQSPAGSLHPLPGKSSQPGRSLPPPNWPDTMVELKPIITRI
jgi:hypothetical protein